MVKAKEAEGFNPDNMDDGDFQEVESDTPQQEIGQFIKLELVGDYITGTYEGNRQFLSHFEASQGRKARTKEQTVYDIRTGEGLVTITGNQDLNSKMVKAPKGAVVRITYVDDSPPPKEGMNYGKVYKVEVSRSAAVSQAVGQRPPMIKRNPNYRSSKPVSAKSDE